MGAFVSACMNVCARARVCEWMHVCLKKRESYRR